MYVGRLAGDHPMKRRKARKSIQAAGGIVIRHDGEPLIAIVQLRKSDEWVLPKGKLDRGESALAAARREVLEEVGHEVDVHEFVGTMEYDVGTRPKVVQFWRMQAIGGPAGRLMNDVKAVAWLPLAAAIERLSHPREQLFLHNVGPAALAAAGSSGPAPSGEPPGIGRPLLERIRLWFRRMAFAGTRRRRWPNGPRASEDFMNDRVDPPAQQREPL
jgi:8-oxo-dGTP diphosphatase